MFTYLHPVVRKRFIQILQPKNCSKICCISLSTSDSCHRNFRSPFKYIKRRAPQSTEKETEVAGEKDDVRGESNFDFFRDKKFLTPGSGHQVLIIQPCIKWGPGKKSNTTPELQLLESVKLIQTLRQWKVVDEIIISLRTFRTKFFFGRGKLQSLEEQIRSSSVISAVFISVNTLSLTQQMILQQVFGVPVFDRYSIIMHIFREHAQTKEAKLQVQLAQLPYLWTILKGVNQGIAEKFGITGEFIGGHGPEHIKNRKQIFKDRQAMLKRKIFKLREQRQKLRKVRGKKNIFTVAVIGYTNAGKTSLIKALTKKESLEPRDYLFATLDVTYHLGLLPSGLQVYYIDTLGFISDIPTYFIESFVSTLEDVTLADAIIHVRDLSHPDVRAQNDNVIQTLEDLNISQDLMNNVITVGNKVDLITEEDLENHRDTILVSCKTLRGIDALRHEIEKKVLASDNKIQIVIRVESGSEEYSWLHCQSTIVKETPDPDNNQFMFVSTIISPSVLAKFKHYFIKNYYKR